MECCSALVSALLRCLLGDATVPRGDEASSERLLGPQPLLSAPQPASAVRDQHTAPPGGALARSAVAPDDAQLGQQGDAAPAATGPTTIIVLRHGHRQDEEDAFWHEHASRPWDPPLSVKGRLQAAQVGVQLAELPIDVVVSSPFSRCLQTSAGVVKQLALDDGRWLVDWQLSEICDPRVLFGHHVEPQSGGVEQWMWGGLGLQQALDKFTKEDCRLNKVALQPRPRPTPAPRYPERVDEGLRRYAQALQEIAASYPGQTVLVVTHGECVRAAVLLASPQSEVFEVKHTGFVVLQQQGPSGGGGARQEQQQWQLTSSPGETGVLWLDDD